jgi:4'-phosphopantetheinyl transferase
MVKVYAVDIRDIVIDLEWLKFVSDYKRQRLRSIRHPQTMSQILIGDLLIRSLAVQYLGVNNQSLLFETNEFGKPYLVTSNQPFCFNLSHSGHWVVCAVDQNPVGIDVQLMEPIDLNLVKNVLSPQGFNYYLNLAFEQRLEYFYDFWTSHESYLKLTGQDLSNLVTISTDQFEKRYYKRYELEPEYRLAVCSDSNQFESDLFCVDIIDIVGDLQKSLRV